MEIMDLFDGSEVMEHLCEEAIQTCKIGFLKFVIKNDLLDFDDWTDYICEYSNLETYKLFEELNIDLDKLAEFGQLEILEYIFEETAEFPGKDGYNAAKENGHDDVVEWLNEMGLDKLYD